MGNSNANQHKPVTEQSSSGSMSSKNSRSLDYNSSKTFKQTVQWLADNPNANRAEIERKRRQLRTLLNEIDGKAMTDEMKEELIMQLQAMRRFFSGEVIKKEIKKKIDFLVNNDVTKEQLHEIKSSLEKFITHKQPSVKFNDEIVEDGDQTTEGDPNQSEQSEPQQQSGEVAEVPEVRDTLKNIALMKKLCANEDLMEKLRDMEAKIKDDKGNRQLLEQIRTEFETLLDENADQFTNTLTGH